MAGFVSFGPYCVWNNKPYRRLLNFLNTYEFTWDANKFPMDKNRAGDGKALIDRYIRDTESISAFFDVPCSVLEMMIALCIRLETHILYNPEDNSHVKWLFWEMIRSMGLYDMNDDNFDEVQATICVFSMLEHTYKPDGKGGLFTVPGSTDMRNKEIWYQAMEYLNYKKYEEEQKIG